MPTTVPSTVSKSQGPLKSSLSGYEGMKSVSGRQLTTDLFSTRSLKEDPLLESEQLAPAATTTTTTITTVVEERPPSKFESVIEDDEWSTQIRDAISRLKVKNGYGGFKTDVGDPVFDLQVRPPSDLGSYMEGDQSRSVSGQESCRTSEMAGSRRMSVSTVTSLDKTLAVELPENEGASMKSFMSVPVTPQVTPQVERAGATTPSIQTKTVSFPAVMETPMNMPSPPPGSVITCNDGPEGDEVQTSLSALRTTLNALESQVMSAILPSSQDSESQPPAVPDIDRQQHIKEMLESPHVPDERHSSPPVLNQKPWKIKDYDSKGKGWCCKLHDKEFTAWCYQSTCNKIVCPECVKQFHVGHGLMKIPKPQEMSRNLQNIKDDDVLEEFDMSLFEAPQQMKQGFAQRAELHRRNISAEYNLETNVDLALHNIEQDTSGLFDDATKKLEYLTGKLNATSATWNTCRRRVITEPSEDEQPPLFAAGYSTISDENKFLNDQIARSTR